MTWYIDMCSSNGHGLTIHVSFMVKCVCYMGLWIHWFRDHDATIPNGSATTGWTSLVGVGHARSDSIVPLMLRTVCCAMVGALALYYRSLRTASTLLRRDNISSKPYYWTMIVVYITPHLRLGNGSDTIWNDPRKSASHICAITPKGLVNLKLSYNSL
jgi:hypothetical protein